MARRIGETGRGVALAYGVARMLDFWGVLSRRVPTVSAAEDLSLAWAAVSSALPEPFGSDRTDAGAASWAEPESRAGVGEAGAATDERGTGSGGVVRVRALKAPGGERDTEPADQDLRYWRHWAGDPGTAAGREEGIERFSRLVAGPDPAGEWDRCRLVLGGLLANRAGQRMNTGWIEPVTTGAGWADANAALELFERAAASPALDADLRRRATIAHARLSAGMATLRAANAMVAGRAPDVGAVLTAARRLASDQYEGTAQLASDLTAQMSGRHAISAPQRQANEGGTAGGQHGLIFEGEQATPKNLGYRGSTASTAAGVTYRQLDYWARTGLVEPSVRPARGSTSERLYGFRDILALRVVKRLLDTGLSIQQVRYAVSYLREQGIDDLARLTLISDGSSIYACTSPDEVIDLLQGGQGVFGIALGRVWQEVEGSLAELPGEPASIHPRSHPEDGARSSRSADSEIA